MEGPGNLWAWQKVGHYEERPPSILQIPQQEGLWGLLQVGADQETLI